MTTHSSILPWRVPWTEEPGRLLPRVHGVQRVRHDWSDLAQLPVDIGLEWATVMVLALNILRPRTFSVSDKYRWLEIGFLLDILCWPLRYSTLCLLHYGLGMISLLTPSSDIPSFSLHEPSLICFGILCVTQIPLCGTLLRKESVSSKSPISNSHIKTYSLL